MTTTPIYRRVNSSHGGYTNFYLNHSLGGWYATWVTDEWSGMRFKDAHEELTAAELREVGAAMLEAADELEGRPEGEDA